ncbi:MAG TPA: phosphoenolpyruvate synthase, partial [Myxococcota bacterium]|nr:phosphoenolpyruvate synthase [Myxococcota bacterium]
MLNPCRRPMLALALALLAARPAAALPDAPTLRGWVEGFKVSDRGPFEVIRWFCNDGTVRPARAGCRGHGDGVQHGDWNAQARALREGGYEIANVLVALHPESFIGPQADLDTWRQILLERFLIGADQGWIYRGAWGYRGAMQIEDEEAAARNIALAMLADPRWRDPARFLLLRESVRVLPLAVNQASAAQVRADALNLANRDAGFAALRAKIHSFPDAGDAERVRQFARTRGHPGLGGSYESLARSIEALYAPSGAAAAVLE